MATCTVWEHFSNPIEKVSLIIMAKRLAADTYKEPVEKIRSLFAQGKKEEAQRLKQQLPAFTPSGVFAKSRLAANLEMYSGYVHLDFDKLADVQLQKAFDQIANDPHTYLCFKSPSGNGLKVFAEVDTGAELHESTWLTVMQYYENLTGVKADEKCKDITRLCFVSYDPRLYHNINNQKFFLASKPTLAVAPKANNAAININVPSTDDQYLFVFQQQVSFTNLKTSYHEGNRNNYIYLLASNCNRAGIPANATCSLVSQSFDLPAKEVQAAINSAYKHHSNEFNTVLTPGFSQENELQQETMPTLPSCIYETIPAFLQQITDVASSEEERDILLLGSLVTLSVAFPKLVGKYGDNRVHSNLYLFISAKASAGKGILIHCRKLVELIHLQLRDQAKLLKRQFDAELQEYNSNKGKDASAEKPQKPPQKMLFIPANNSATGFLEILGDSEGRGIIFETEGDTLSKAFKSDYGDFSDSFRNAFQHEPVSYYRRTDKEYIEILQPCLSVLLSGTPRQIQILIPDAENGLFSRFMFYVMNMRQEWKDVFASKTESGLQLHFEKLGQQFFQFFQVLMANPEISFSLTTQQQQRFNQYFASIQNLYIAVQEEDIISTVRRLGLTAYRIMMIFTVLRLLETGELPNSIICSDEDFENTLQMISVLVKHSSYVFTQIAQEGYKPKPKNRKEKFLECLPKNFKRQEYLTIALALGIPDKTAQRYISELVTAGILQHDAHDNYTNPHAATVP